MKKSLFAVMLAMVLFVACKKDKNYSISLSESEVTMHYKETKQLSLTYSDDDIKDIGYVYSSSDVNVATVSNTGLVEAISIGKAIITVMSKDGKYKAECNVIVESQYNIYVEPFRLWGATKEQIKSVEIRSLYNEEKESLTYNGLFSTE